jgi:Polyketide cyclase / dehydrase and lipid transport
MASIHQQTSVEVGADRAWAAVRQVGDAHTLFAPVLVEGKLDRDVRTVRFANGMIVRERILDVDDERRRVAYTVLDGPGMTYHHASMQIVDAGPNRSLFIWITDFLPHEIGGDLAPLIDQGAKALKSNLEAR